MKRRVEHLFAGVEGRSGRRTSGVVDENVDAIELLERLGHDLIELSRLHDVTGHGQGTPSAFPDFLRHGLDLLRGTRGAHHIGAELGEGQGGALANTAAGSGYDRHFSIETKSIENHEGPPILRASSAGTRDAVVVVIRSAAAGRSL